MDAYGNDISNNFSGNVSIDGDITADDGTFENITVTDTAMIDTLISVVELEVKDPIITCGVDNVADAINLGLIEEYKSGGSKRWAGLVRDSTSKAFYLLREEAVKPGPSTPMPDTRPQLASIFMNQLNSYNANVENAIILGPVGGNFVIEGVRGTNGQVLTYDNNYAVWADASGGSTTLQDAFDNSDLTNQIITNATRPTFQIKDEQVGPAIAINDGFLETIELHSSGLARMKSIKIADGGMVDKFNIALDGVDLSIKDEALSGSVKVLASGGLAVCDNLNNTKFSADVAGRIDATEAHLNSMYMANSPTFRWLFDMGVSNELTITPSGAPFKTITCDYDTNEIKFHDDKTIFSNLGEMTNTLTKSEHISLKNSAGDVKFGLSVSLSDEYQLKNSSNKILHKVELDGKHSFYDNNDELFFRIHPSFIQSLNTPNTAASFYLSCLSNTTAHNQSIHFIRTRGTTSVETPVLSGDSIGATYYRGYVGGANYPNVGAIEVIATQNYTPTTLGCDMVFSTTYQNGSALSQRLKIRNDGLLTFGSDVLGYSFPAIRGTTGQTLIDVGSGVLGWTQMSRIIKSLTSSVVVTNTITNTALLNYGASRTDWKTGDVFKVTTSGQINNPVSAVGVFQITLNNFLLNISITFSENAYVYYTTTLEIQFRSLTEGCCTFTYESNNDRIVNVDLFTIDITNTSNCAFSFKWLEANVDRTLEALSGTMYKN